MVAVRERIHQLVDELPEVELNVVELLLAGRRATTDPVLQALANAPADDEPLTDDEAAAVKEGFDDIARGDVVSDTELDQLLRR